MAYSNTVQSTLEVLGEKLQEPTGIATLISLGVHGALWLFLPLIPFSPIELDEPEIRGAVQVVELTPDEMQRLPDMPEAETPTPPPAARTNSLPYTLSPMPNPFSRLPTPVPPAPRFREPGSLFIPPLLPPLPPRGNLTRPRPTTPRTATRTQLPEFPRGGLGPTIPFVPRTTPASPSATPSTQPSPSATPQQPAISMEQLIAQQRELLTFNAEGTTQESAQQTYISWFAEAVKQHGDREPRRLRV